jgi:hypothetical protein
MRLDEFDSLVLARKGKAQEILQDLYGHAIGQNNAEKQLAGIRLHLRYKEKNDEVLELEEITISADGSRTTKTMIELSDTSKNDPKTIMEKMGLDPLQWEMKNIDLKRGYWNTALKTGKETNHTYKCEIKATPLQEVLSTDMVCRVFEGLQAPSLKKYKYTPADLMWELPLMDIHIGKMAWANETEEDNYDIKIAGERSRKTVEDFLAKANGYEKILFPIGQDFFHIDNTENETTLGTRMDVDGRWEKIYQTGVEFLVWAIEELRRLAPVDVFYIPGNHDKMLSYCATQTVSAYFRNTDSVIVDLSPAPRKYRQFGLGMVGFSHGKEGKRIEKLMQIEQPEMWGATRFREFHLGDLHHEKVWEDGGIIFRRIPAITSTDAWHTEKGYKGAIRKAQAFEWDKELGIVNIQNSVVT